MTFTRSLRIAALVLASFAAVPFAAAQTPEDSDLRALRFYVREGDEQAIASELRRLQLQYPSWTPPDDLSDLNEDIPTDRVDGIYRLIDAGRFDDARAEMDAIGRDFPSWTPSLELMQTLATAESQARFDSAIDAGDATSAVRIAQGNPALLRCERVNNAWLLAEQYQALDRPEAALEVYRGVIGSCTEPDQLVATLQKAAAVTSVAELETLADTARGQAPGAATRISEVEDQLRAGLGAQPRGTTAVRGAVPDRVRQTDRGGRPLVTTPAPARETQPEPTAPPVDIEANDAAVARSLRPAERPSDLAEGRAAAPAPATRLSPGAMAEIAQVERRPLANLGGATGGGGGGTASSGSAVARAAQAGDWQRCIALAGNSTAPAIVAQRGWCAYNLNRSMQALKDFRSAAAMGPSAQARNDARYGMALTMLRLGMTDQAAQVAASTHFTRQQRLEIESQILDQRGVKAYQRRDYRRAIAYFDELERLTGVVRRDLALLRGYAYLNSGQKAAAQREFRALHNQMATPETRRALSEALR